MKLHFSNYPSLEMRWGAEDCIQKIQRIMWTERWELYESRRKEILELADLKFDVMPSDAQEITTKTAPNEVVMELASIKAKRHI